LARALQKCAAAVPRRTASAWEQFSITLAQLEDGLDVQRPAELIQHVLEAAYEEYLEDHFSNYQSRLEDLRNLASFARQFRSTGEFLTQVSLLTNVEAEEQQPTEADDEKTRLTTIHQAKGLEFDVVFLIMLCDGLFPSSRSLESAEGEEEERRLFYVAITRARNELYLSYPLGRGMSGYGDIKPSRFLRELSEDLVDSWSLRSVRPYG
jgi:DNA helicase-2/ATP-dependent DNA helicase PcrA